MTTDSEPSALDLLYPFYLDEDMSMAFAAALAGGVTLETEQVDRTTDTSQAVKNLRGSLRLWRAGGVAGDRGETKAADAMSESRLSRHHTVASIFIDLYDELRQSGRLTEEPAIGDAEVGDMVSMRLEPAVAPLRRVVDQVLRLLDVTLPMADLGADDGPDVQGLSRQQRRAQAREAGKRALQPQEDDSAVQTLGKLRDVFVALRDDLDHSGMIDIAVRREDGPSVILTLDKRFVSPPTLELLHSSAFIVVGKVTQVWSEPEDIVNLFRRSVLSLLPSLAQVTVWGVFSFLVEFGRSLDASSVEQSAQALIGNDTQEEASVASQSVHAGAEEAGDDAAEEAQPPESDDATSNDEDDDEYLDDVVIGVDAVSALNPIVTGPALQILPLAICS